MAATTTDKPVSTQSLAKSAELASRMALFLVEEPRRNLSDLVVAHETGELIHQVVVKIRNHQLLYERFGLAQVDPNGGKTAINFYGPPGTGKSMAAEALATELGMGIIRANYAEIESKFVGETPKNIRAAFQKASENHALLFFDEADSILGKRLSNVSQSTDHAVNVSRSVMLLALDNFKGVVVFATNLASNYDEAFVRRILAHVPMTLPNAELRRRLWEKHMPPALPVKLSAADRQRLVSDSAGLSGGDILNCVVNAAAAAVAREGDQCTIRLADFRMAIKAAKLAKQSVGAAR